MRGRRGWGQGLGRCGGGGGHRCVGGGVRGCAKIGRDGGGMGGCGGDGRVRPCGSDGDPRRAGRHVRHPQHLSDVNDGG
ncbi:MAG: hypothetical protein MZV64_59820 [Ignavibacteriales bacterium]|nr:hypothetical protein [Ignavibacteriales bacterium]